MFKPVIRPSFAVAAALAILMARSAAGDPVLPLPKKADEIRVTFVNVGAGLCTVIECPGDPEDPGALTSGPILYDCGSSGRAKGLTRDQVVEFVGKIFEQYAAAPRVVVSHADSDHNNYIPYIMRGKPAGGIWLGGERKDYSKKFQAFLNEQEIKKVEVVSFDQRGESLSVDALSCGNGVPTSNTLLLTVNAGDTKNDKSMVLRIMYGEFSATMTGDATGESLASLLANFYASNIKLTTTLLGAPHHGAVSDGSNSFIWPQVFRPEIVVYSAGQRFFHPRCDAVNEYSKSGFLLPASQHPLQCGVNKSYLTFDSTYAEYLTATNDNIWVTSNGEKTTVECPVRGDNNRTLDPCSGNN